MAKLSALPLPSESQEGDQLVAYLRWRGIPFTHIPNETGSSEEAKRRAVRMKRQGVSRGFPDYVIALPDVGMLYIELKRQKGSRVSPEQQAWVDVINRCPNAEAHICHGARAAIDVIESIYPVSKQATAPAADGLVF